MFYGTGLIIDKEKSRYKKYVSVLFFKVGDWETLPKVSSIAITKVDGSQTMNSARTMGNSATFKVELFCVYFCVDDKKILVKKTKNKNEAIELANGAASYLNAPLNNYVKEG
jgi:hypothetical protein